MVKSLSIYLLYCVKIVCIYLLYVFIVCIYCCIIIVYYFFNNYYIIYCSKKKNKKKKLKFSHVFRRLRWVIRSGVTSVHRLLVVVIVAITSRLTTGSCNTRVFIRVATPFAAMHKVDWRSGNIPDLSPC